MGFYEDTKDRLATIVGLGTISAGFGYSIYKSIPPVLGQFRGTGQAIAQSVKGVPPPLVPSVVRKAPESAATIEKFQEAQRIGLDIMGEEGWRTAVKKAVHASALGSGRIGLPGIAELLEEIERAEPDQLLNIIKRTEHRIGGVGSVYSSLSGLMGSRMRGNRGRTLPEMISELGSWYHKSQFGNQGSFWKEQLKFLDEPILVSELRHTPLSNLKLPGMAKKPIEYARDLEAALESMGIQATVTPGVREVESVKKLKDLPDYRDVSREKPFTPGSGFNIKRTIGGRTIDIPYAELQISVGGQRAYIPLQYAKEGFVASGMGKMSTAAVRQFTVPGPAGKRTLVDWNEALSMMLYGEGGGVGENLATMIYKAQQEGKSLRQTGEAFNQIVRSQVREVTVLPHAHAGKWVSTGVTSTAGAQIIAAAHQFTYVPLEELMVRGQQPGAVYATAELAKIMQAAEESGIPSFPLASPTSISKSAAMSLIPFHMRWNIYGADFPYERRFMQAIRDFEPTKAATAAMEASPIYGRLSRTVPVTATQEYIKEVVATGYKAPNVVMAYALKGSKSLRPEEVLVSRSMADMMETQTIQTHYLSSEFPSIAPGTILEEGQLIGVGAKGEGMIYSQAAPGRMTERVIGSETRGGITRLTVAREFPLQEQAKIFGIKATLRLSSDPRYPAERQWGQVIMPEAEAYGSVELLKKNPAMIKSQMTEATLLLGAQKMAALEASGQNIPEEMQRIFGKGGRRYLRDLLSKASGTYGQEEKILSLAKGWRFTGEELGWVAGHWYELELDKIKKMSDDRIKKAATAELTGMMDFIGITEKEIEAIRKARFVLGAPTFYFGDYPTLNRWERGSIEPRGIKELLLQDWQTEKGTPIGRMLATELERRRIPVQDLDEMERVLASMAGKVPAGFPELTQAEALAKMKVGEGGFLMKLPGGLGAFEGRRVYVPAEARLMQYFSSEIGEELPQTLLSDYIKLANSSLRAEAGKDGAAESMEVAARNLKDAAYKQWLLATQARGKVAGTTAPVMQSWLTRHMHFETVEEFARSQEAFTIGVGRETLRETFQDLIRIAPEAEKEAIRKEMARALKEGHGYGIGYRHPMIYPYSTIPVRYRVAGDADFGIFFPTITVGKKRVDVSGMLGMAADTDFDRAIFGVVADQKMISALEETVNDTRFKRQYAHAMEMQHDLETIAKKQIGAVSTDYNKIEGLKRLAGLQVATPEVSVAAQKLKLALHHAQSPEQRLVLSTFITQLEQRAISAKQGGAAEVISKAVRNAVTGWTKGESGLQQTKDEFARAWTAVWGHEVFKAGETTFDVNQMYQQLSGLMDTARAGEHITYADRIVRRASRANRGATIAAGSMDEIMQDIKAYRAGIGDPAADLVRAMRQGPGSAATMMGTAATQAASKWGVFKQAMMSNWKYPAMGIGAAVGARYLFGTSPMEMPEPQHDQKATEQIMNMPKAPPPMPVHQAPQVIQTAGGSWGHPGMEASFTGDYDLEGTRNLMNYARGISQDVAQGSDRFGRAQLIIQDMRGSITPEYIRKSMDERYY